MHRNHKANKMSSEFLRCVICMDNVATIKSVPCDHKVMCDGCVIKWLKLRDASKELKCAVCRAEVAILVTSTNSLLIGTPELLKILYGNRPEAGRVMDKLIVERYVEFASSAIDRVKLVLTEVTELLLAPSPVRTLHRLEDILGLVQAGQILGEENATVLIAIFQECKRVRAELEKGESFSVKWFA